MPKKPNNGGMQEYVPAGNSAGGEYANESGSNVHFASFKKPDGEEKQQVKVVENKPKENKPSKTLKENIESKFKTQNERTKKLAEHIEIESNENVSILNKMLSENDKLTIKFGGSGRNSAGCAWGYADINLDVPTVHVFRHENGHVFDAFYGKDLETNEDKYPMSRRLVTRWIDEKENMSFDEVLHSELGINGYDTVLKGFRISYRKRGVDKREDKIKTIERLTKIYNDYGDEIMEEKTGIKNATKIRKELAEKERNIDKKIIEMADNDSEVQELDKEYKDANREVMKAEENYANEMRLKGFYSIYYANSPEVMRAREKRDNISAQYTKIRNSKKELFEKQYGLSQEEKETIQKINSNYISMGVALNGLNGLMGDTEDYMGVSRSTYITKGHGNSYFMSRKDDGFSCEIWANFFDCYLDKNKKKWEVAKKMYPRATAVFERAINKFGR